MNSTSIPRHLTIQQPPTSAAALSEGAPDLEGRQEKPAKIKELTLDVILKYKTIKSVVEQIKTNDDNCELFVSKSRYFGPAIPESAQKLLAFAFIMESTQSFDESFASDGKLNIAKFKQTLTDAGHGDIASELKNSYLESITYSRGNYEVHLDSQNGKYFLPINGEVFLMNKGQYSFRLGTKNQKTEWPCSDDEAKLKTLRCSISNKPHGNYLTATVIGFAITPAPGRKDQLILSYNNTKIGDVRGVDEEKCRIKITDHSKVDEFLAKAKQGERIAAF